MSETCHVLVLFDYFTCKFVFFGLFIYFFFSIYFALEVPGNSSVVDNFGISQLSSILSKRNLHFF